MSTDTTNAAPEFTADQLQRLARFESLLVGFLADTFDDHPDTGLEATLDAIGESVSDQGGQWGTHVLLLADCDLAGRHAPSAEALAFYRRLLRKARELRPAVVGWGHLHVLAAGWEDAVKEVESRWFGQKGIDLARPLMEPMVNSLGDFASKHARPLAGLFASEAEVTA